MLSSMNCSGHCLEASLARNGTVVAATGQVWVLPWGQTKQGCSAPAADHHDGLTPLQLGVIISSCVGVVVCIACCGALLYRRLGPAKRERSKSIGDTFREMVSADEAERVHVNPASHAQISSVSVCERGMLRTLCMSPTHLRCMCTRTRVRMWLQVEMKEIVATLGSGSHSWQIEFDKIQLERKVAAGASGVVQFAGC